MVQPMSSVPTPAENNPPVNQQPSNPPANPEQSQTGTPASAVPDIVSRASQFKINKPPEQKSEGSDIFDVRELEKIATPEQAKEFAEKAYKSFQSDFTKKYQTLAEQRKQFESLQADMGNWNAEKLNNLLNNPSFVEAAKQVAGMNQSQGKQGLTEEEYSMLTPAEKARLDEIDNKMKAFEQANFKQKQVQEDEKLKTRYANYDAGSVDTLLNEMMNGKIQATREHLWKVLDYESAVQRAYELGKQDRQLENTEKVGAFSINGNNIPQPESFVSEKGESGVNFFKRIALKRLSESRGRS